MNPKGSRLVVLFALLSVLSACASGPRPQVSRPEVPDIPMHPPVERDGSLFQPQRGTLAMFTDRRPQQAGDIITIDLNEQVSASKNSAANGTRSSSASFMAGDLSEALQTLGDYNFGLSGESEFSGTGAAEANNTFSGTITVTVREVLPNGNLFVSGEKQIAINQGTEYIRFSGIVDPHSISARNSVPSSEVASARIEYLGDGYVNDMQRMSWLQRMLLWLSPF